MQQTHGTPEPHTWDVDTTGRAYGFRKEIFHLQVSANSGVVRVYFSQAAFDANTDEFVELDAAAAEFYEGPAWVRMDGVWLRAVGGAAQVTAVGYYKIV